MSENQKPTKTSNKVESLIKEIIKNGDEDIFFDSFENNSETRQLKKHFTAVHNGQPINANEKSLKKIIDYFSSSIPFQSFEHYKRLVSQITEEDHDQKLLNNFIGNYTVFIASESQEQKVKRENIEIYQDNYSKAFYYKSYPEGKQAAPAHYGCVLYMLGKMYLTGFGPNFMRPILLDLGKQPGKGSGENEDSILNPSEQIIHGIVLSVTNESSRVFARHICFILEHSKNSNISDNEMKKILHEQTEFGKMEDDTQINEMMIVRRRGEV